MARLIIQPVIYSQTKYPMRTKRNLFLLLIAAWIMHLPSLLAQPCQIDVQIDPPTAMLTCQNPSVQVQATVDPPGNYFISWQGPAQLPNVLNPVITVPGTYSLFVFDSMQCWGGDTIVITKAPDIPEVLITASSITCDVQNDPVILSAVVTGGGNYSYTWTTGESTAEIEVSDPGAYCVTITDLASGCTATTCFALTLPAPLALTFTYSNQFFCGDSTVLCLDVQGGIPPYQYTWNTGSGGQWWSCVFDPTPGNYTATVTDAFGCSQVATFVVEEDPNECAHVTGQVLADWNTNCTIESSDDGLSGIIIHIENTAGDEFYAYTDNDGAYSIELYPGDYTFEVLPPNALWNPCVSPVNISLGVNQTLTQDFLLQPLADCPAMTVDVVNSLLRRCFNGQYYIQYCNQGTADATGAYVDFELDPLLTLADAGLPYTDLGNNQYRFELGDVPFNTCGNFWVKVTVSCNATLGQTLCSEAIIFPTGNCEPENPLWSGASLQLSAACQGDSLDFTIQNIGAGDMVDPLDYVIIEDAVMFMQAPPPITYLASGAEHHVKLPANGHTWRLEVDQAPFHPGNSQPSLSVEGCTTNSQFTTGFVTQFPADDNDPWVDFDCSQVVGSYDPNDKQGYPTGYSQVHYIKRGTDIEYLIRFQNTGTDTAFTVVIRDELSSALDPGSVVPGAASHPYRFEYFGDRNIKFTFPDINLPDSTTNLEGSQGYVSFRISQKDALPLETDILNTAGIYFDFNEPVYTNTTTHRVGENFVVVSTWQPFLAGVAMQVMPNPVTESALFILDGLSANAEWQVALSDVTGRPVRRAVVNGSQWQFERNGLPAGIYFLRVLSAGQVIGSGKVILK